MRPEQIANRLGITHRTTLYHLNILEDCDIIEVGDYKAKGRKMLKSTWGIKQDKQKHVDILFEKIDEHYPREELEQLINTNVARR